MKIVIERDSPPDYPLTRITVELSNETSRDDMLDALVTLARGVGYWIDRETLEDWIESSFPKEEE